MPAKIGEALSTDLPDKWTALRDRAPARTANGWKRPREMPNFVSQSDGLVPSARSAQNTCFRFS